MKQKRKVTLDENKGDQHQANKERHEPASALSDPHPVQPPGDSLNFQEAHPCRQPVGAGRRRIPQTSVAPCGTMEQMRDKDAWGGRCGLRRFQKMWAK